MAMDTKLKYLCVILISFYSLSAWASSADDIVESMLLKLQDTYDRVPPDKVKVDLFQTDKRAFEYYGPDSGNGASYFYLKSKKGEFVKDYGMMYKRIGIAKYTFADSVTCDSFMISLLSYFDVAQVNIDRVLNGPGFVEIVKAPLYLLLRTSNDIVKVYSRCADYSNPDGGRDWKQMARMLLGYPQMIDANPIVICYCGGPLLIADSAYFANDSILPPIRGR